MNRPFNLRAIRSVATPYAMNDAVEAHSVQAHLHETQAQDRYLRSILDTMQECLLIFDDNGTVLFANQKATSLLRQSAAGRVIGQRIDRLLPLHEAEVQMQLIRQVITTGETLRRQVKFTLGREFRWFDSSISPTIFGEHHAPAALCISLDITAQKLQANQILLSEKRYRRLFENMTDGVIYFDRKGRILSMNPAAETIFGYGIQEMQQRFEQADSWDVFLEDGSRCPREAHPVFRCLASGEPIADSLLKVFNPETKKDTWINLSVAPLHRDGDPSPFQIFATIRDVTKKTRERMIHALRLRILEAADRLPTRQLLELILGRIGELVGSPVVVLHLIDDRSPTPAMEACVCTPDSGADGAFLRDSVRCRSAFDTTLMQRCLRDGQAIISNHPVQLAVKPTGTGRWPSADRMAAVPVIRGGRIVAILSLAGKQREYTADDTELVRKVADLLWEIIERKRFDEERQEYQRQLDVLISNLPGMAFRCETDANRTIRFASAGSRELAGYAPEALLDNHQVSFNSLIHPDDRDRVHQVIRESLAGGRAYELEYRLLHDDGRHRFVLERGIGVGSSGRQRMIEGFITDVTAGRSAQRKIRETYRQLLTILNGIDAHIYVADMENYEVLFMNRKMQNDFGEDMTGLTCWQVFQNDDGPCGHCTNDQLFNIDGTPKEAYVWERKNPVTERWYVNYDRAVKWIDNRWVRMQIALDITDRKETEAKLLQSQKMEAIGILAGGIAHDFNNILSVILGYAGMAIESREPMGKQLRRDLEQINRAGLRAQDLVRQILGFSRQSEEQFVAMEMGPLLKETVKMLRASFPSSIRIETKIAATDSPVLADASQMHQVFMNLCTNALHAMENTGTLAICLTTAAAGENLAASNQTLPWPAVHITISDTGIGMTEATRARIFEPFFTTKGQGKGTGLGLSVVRGIIQHHQGQISVESTPGKGTDFHIYLPVAARNASANRQDEPGVVAGGNEQILLVDDEKQIINMLGQMLGKLGYATTLFIDSEEALAAFRNNPRGFDLVITDMTMPNLNGLELAEAMHGIRPELPVIICTGFSEVLNEKNAKTAGISEILLKPVPRATLAKAVRRSLDHAAA